MTAQETERIDSTEGSMADTPGRSSAAGKAYNRRLRRQQSVTARLTTTGSPITAALTRVPFVALIILLLAGGVVGVLYLNTVSDATGLKASASRRAQLDLNSQIEAANKDIADLKNPAKLAAEARALGLVPAGDAAIISVGANGQVSIIGTPTPVPAFAPAAPAAPVAAAVPTTTAVTTAAVTTTAVTTTAVTTTAAKTTIAKTTGPATTAAKPTPTPATHAKATVPKAPAPKPTGTTTAGTAASRITASTTGAAKTTPGKATTRATTGSTKQTTTPGAGQ